MFSAACLEWIRKYWCGGNCSHY